MRRESNELPGPRSLEARLQFQPGHSTALLNEYYHHEYSRGMQSLARLSQLHDKIVVEDKSLQIDQRDEITWEEYNQSRQKLKQQVKKLKQQRKEMREDRAKRQQYMSLQKGGTKTLRSELLEQSKYSKKKNSPLKPSQSRQLPQVQAPPDPNTFRTELIAVRKTIPPEISRSRADSLLSDLPPLSSNRSRSPSRVSQFSSVIKLRKVESGMSDNDALNKSEVMSMVGKGIVSEIPMDMRSEIDQRQRSIYSLALKSHLSKKTKRSSKSKQPVEKKNFKKAFLEKKYNTSNLSQLHHKMQKENELQVRELRRIGMVNFSAVMHERKEERDAAVELVQQRKTFEAMKDTIYREISRPTGNPLIEQRNLAGFVPRRPAKPHYEDLASSIENIQIRQYQMEESMISEEKEIQAQESMAQYQAIYEVFEGRHKRNNSSKQDSSNHEREESSSFSRYYATEQQKGHQPARAIEQHSHEEEDSMMGPSQEQLDLQAKQEAERVQRIIGDQLFGFASKIQFRDNPYFEGALRRLIAVADKVKYDGRDVISSTKQRVLLLLEELLAERQAAKKEYQRFNQQILRYKQQLAEHLDSNGEPLNKKYKHSDEVSRVISESSLQIEPNQADEESLERALLINKVVIKKLVQKSCQLFEYNVHRSMESPSS